MPVWGQYSSMGQLLDLVETYRVTCSLLDLWQRALKPSSFCKDKGSLCHRSTRWLVGFVVINKNNSLVASLSRSGLWYSVYLFHISNVFSRTTVSWAYSTITEMVAFNHGLRLVQWLFTVYLIKITRCLVVVSSVFAVCSVYWRSRSSLGPNKTATDMVVNKGVYHFVALLFVVFLFLMLSIYRWSWGMVTLLFNRLLLVRG